MRPAARVQTAIEMLDEIVAAARTAGAPADRLVAEGFRQRRYAGSKDRRAVRQLVYDAIRACGPVPQDGRAAMLRLAKLDPEIAALFDGSDYGPAKIGSGEKVAGGGIAPDWLVERLAESGIAGDGARALIDRAPLDVRVNTLKTSREAIDLPEPGEPLAPPNALRFASGTPVERWDAYDNGLIEVQDAGSQVACLAVAAQPGEVVIDLCAGAGGKTLALAAAMNDEGTLVAADTDRGRLDRIGARANRAGVEMGESVLLDPGQEAAALAQYAGKADAVLVDAPCSGTGTWRRNPEARWRLKPRMLERHVALQERLLDIAATLVKPGGRVIHVVCSLLDAEGRDQAARFLERHPDWRADTPDLPLGSRHGDGWRLTPLDDGTDGFFIARFVSAC